MEKRDGFLPVYWVARQGKVYVELARFGEEILHYTSLPAGVGSNDLGLDRGQVGGSRIVRFERVGRKVLLEESNQAFRSSGDAAARRSVEESFATSVLFGFEVVAEQGNAVLVDATPFVLRDGHGVGAVLERAKQGRYAVDSRAAPRAPGIRPS
jgi:hypothetical protein